MIDPVQGHTRFDMLGVLSNTPVLLSLCDEIAGALQARVKLILRSTSGVLIILLIHR